MTQLTLSSNDGLESLTEKIKEQINFGGENKVYGILIDLCLNGEGTNSIRFTASPIAQHLRTLASTTYEIPNIPLVLCSTIEKIKKLTILTRHVMICMIINSLKPQILTGKKLQKK